MQEKKENGAYAYLLDSQTVVSLPTIHSNPLKRIQPFREFRECARLFSAMRSIQSRSSPSDFSTDSCTYLRSCTWTRAAHHQERGIRPLNSPICRPPRANDRAALAKD